MLHPGSILVHLHESLPEEFEGIDLGLLKVLPEMHYWQQL
jgi:hypothetical protein